MVSVEENFSRLATRTQAELILNLFLTTTLLGVVALQLRAEGSREWLRKEVKRQRRHWVKDMGDGRLCRLVRRATGVALVFKLGVSCRLFASTVAAQIVDWYCATIVSFIVTGVVMLIGAELANQAQTFANKQLYRGTSNSLQRALLLTGAAIALMTAGMLATFIVDRRWLISIVHISLGILLATVVTHLWSQAVKIHKAVTQSTQVHSRTDSRELSSSQMPAGRSISGLSNTSNASVSESRSSRMARPKSVALAFSTSPIKRFFKFLIFGTICVCVAEAVIVILTLDSLSSTDKVFFRPEDPGDELYTPPISYASITQFIVAVLFLWQSWGGFTWRGYPDFLLTPHLTQSIETAHSTSLSSPIEESTTHV